MAYYLIKSKMTGFVLDVEKGRGAGSRVIPWDKHGKDNQLWYDDPSTGTIRSKSGNLCLDIENDQLVVKPFEQGDPNQQWVRQDHFIRNRKDNNKVLDVFKENKEKGAKISVYKYNGKNNQQWDFEMVGGPGPQVAAATSYPGYPMPSDASVGAGRQFYIVSEYNGKVVDIEKAIADVGARLVMWDKNSPPSKNQLWYLDAQGCIRSVLNDFAFTNTSNAVLKTAAPSGDPRSQWSFSGNKVISRSGECLDIAHGSKSNGAEVFSYPIKDTPNQHWRQEFI
jgi:hypothetical protein